VTIADLDGIEHTDHVSAGSLYEAVALGLQAIRRSAWAGQIPEGLTRVTGTRPPGSGRTHGGDANVPAMVGTTGHDAKRMARAKVKEILAR
jgi:hypothetical protein